MSLRHRLGSVGHLPMLLQMEAAECGLACLTMIGVYHGHRITLPALRRQFTLSRRGSNMTMLMDLATRMKLDARAIKLPLRGLDELQLPCILHWGMDHFVVLKSVKSDHVVIHDPAIGARRIAMDEASKYFTGVAMELSPATDFTPMQNQRRISVRSVMGRIIGLKRSLLQIMVLTTALELVAILLPFQMQWLIDTALPSADIELITTIGIGFLLLVLLQAGITALRGWMIVRVSAHLNFQWQGNVFRHLMRLPLDYFQRRHIGSILTNVESINTIQHTIARDFSQVMIDGLLAIGTLIMLFMYSLKLTLIVVAAMLLYAATRLVMYPKMRNSTAETLIADGKIYTHFMESVRGIQTIRLLGGEHERVMIWRNLLAERFNGVVRTDMVSANSHAADVLLFGLQNVIVVWLAVLAVLNNQLTVGMLFVYLVYKQQFSQRVVALVDKAAEWRLLGLHAERVADIAHSEPELVPPLPSMQSPGAFTASIELRNVWFQYGSSEAPVLKDVSLRIEPGECVAISGISGCGKTTLIKLMLGLIKPTAGEVLVSGMPLQVLGVERYRREVAAVMQEDMLFSGSIGDNISFFDASPDAARIQECARHAAIHDDIMTMPMGYNTLIGDVGTGLSGGQAQRVLLARALYRQPALLFLDEATSHLDVWNERAVNDAIKGMQLTRILIAHRPETIAMADRVIHMENGRIVTS